MSFNPFLSLSAVDEQNAQTEQHEAKALALAAAAAAAVNGNNGDKPRPRVTIVDPITDDEEREDDTTATEVGNKESEERRKEAESEGGSQKERLEVPSVLGLKPSEVQAPISPSRSPLRSVFTSSTKAKVERRKTGMLVEDM